MKKIPRRQFLRLATCAAAWPAVPRIARAQAFPSRPVRIIVGFPAGGTSDVLARLIGQWLSERLGQPFVVENRSGAGGTIGTEAVVRATPDGHTLLILGVFSAIAATVYDKLNFNFVRDIAPVAGLIRLPGILEVNPTVPAKTVSELIAYAKANPGKITVASSGPGSAAHVYAELFKMMAGLETLHVPYRGAAPALTDLIGGQVHVMFDNVSSSIGYIRAGQLRALAVTTATRAEVLPDIPTLGEFLPGYEASGWQGLGAPKNTPAEIIDRLNGEINAALVDPKMKAKLAALGGTVLAGSPGDFGRLIAEETEKWARVVKFAGIKPS
jgi:tripartite-type tricarboxylate transporter receptor subunit TctC